MAVKRRKSSGGALNAAPLNCPPERMDELDEKPQYGRTMDAQAVRGFEVSSCLLPAFMWDVLTLVTRMQLKLDETQTSQAFC
jgi:hypothetical protein